MRHFIKRWWFSIASRFSRRRTLYTLDGGDAVLQSICPRKTKTKHCTVAQDVRLLKQASFTPIISLLFKLF